MSHATVWEFEGTIDTIYNEQVMCSQLNASLPLQEKLQSLHVTVIVFYLLFPVFVLGNDISIANIFSDCLMKLLWMFGFAVEVIAGGFPTNSLGSLSETFPTFVGVSMESWTLMKFILDFARRSRWESVVFFFSNSSGFSNTLSPVLFNYFNAEGKFVAVHTTSHPLLPKSVLHLRHHLGIVYFCDTVDETFLNKVSELDFFDAYRSWLIIKPENIDNRLRDVLGGLNIGLVTNLVIATLSRRVIPTVWSPTTTAATISEFFLGYRKRQVQEEICEDRSKRDLTTDVNLIVRLSQVYKAAVSENETISVELGSWDVPNGLFKTKLPINPEERWDLGGYKVSVGVKNSTQEVVGNLISDRFSFESQIDEESRFLELFDCLMTGMNASFEVVQFQKLGWRNEEGGWTHLLGAVVDGTVDFALETINPNLDKAQDMSFTYAIVITMNNIYFRRPSSTGLRDIFLAAFSTRLLICVFTTGLLLAIAMISITIVTYHIDAKKPSSEVRIFTKGKRERAVVVVNKEERKWEFSEAALWSVSVMCMQGSQWSPKSISGSLLLINSLLFALIIYNSFAAFITSVLSVKDDKIKSLKDLAGSEFAFGYTLGDTDELFLRTVNNTLLRELYFKGLRENDGVSNPIAGMQLAAKGKYAFFVGARTARRALRTVIAHDRRCELQELYLPVTKSFSSIPVTKKSLFKKILNYKIIRLMESGILHRFQRLILPSMPRCVEKTAFNSARLTDVYSAFFVLSTGWIASVLILFTEVVWHQRKKMKEKTFRENLMVNGFKSREGFYWLK